VVGNVIGRGEFATVKLGEHVASCRKVAMKWLDRDRLDQKIQREISNQRSLNHENVVKIQDVFETDDSICIVLDYVPGGDLFDYIVRHVRLKEDEAKRIFRQLIAGIGHCHEQKVVHRDLKPENILMDANFNVKIADFGLSSNWCPGELLTESCGSPNYAAPELLSKGCKYEGPEVDIWSCGVVLYTLLCGCLPFDDDSVPNLFKKIKNGRYSLPGHLSHEPKDLIMRILTVDPAQRITMAEILQHEWLRDPLAVGGYPVVDATAPVIASPAPAAAAPAPAPVTVLERQQVAAQASAGAVAAETAKCQRAKISAMHLSPSGDRRRWMRTGSGRFRGQCDPTKSAARLHEVVFLRSVRTM